MTDHPNPNSTRRKFLTATGVGLAAIGAAQPLLADEPKLPVAIDAHTHFYDPTRPQGVPWPGRDDKKLYRKVLPAEFKTLTAPFNVQGTVIVEASPWLEDNQWLLDLAADDPFVLGVVGNLDARSISFPVNLARFAKHKKFRGIRINHGELKKGLDDKSYLKQLQLLVDHDLALDVNGGPDMPADVAKLAEKLPELRIVINHAANQPIDGKEIPAAWFAGLKAAAKHKHVHCKVSALVEATGKRNGDAPTDLNFYRLALNAIWEAFAGERLIYASNWPVSDNAASYATVHDIVYKYFRAAGGVVPAQFFAENAKAAYKLS